MRTDIQILFVVSLMLLSGCTVQEDYRGKLIPDFVSEEAKQQINSTKVVVSLEQDKNLGIPVIAQRTSHQYYGVIGKLVESGMIRFENNLSEEHRRLLRIVDMAAFRFDTGVKFREAAESGLGSIAWLKVSSVINQTDLQIPDIDSMVQTQDEDALMLIDIRYLMAIDFSSITVFSDVSLYAHDETLIKIAKDTRPYEDPPTLYKKLFSYEFRYAGSYTTADDALNGWSKNEGEMVERAISESITDLMQQLVTDLSLTTSK
ncbi:hypothetical protein [Kaarinaea lacus]